MRRHTLTITLVLAIMASVAALWPSPTFACDIRDPGCFIDDFVHKQLYQLCLSVWQLNRAGLVVARWFEDLRVWLIQTVMVNAFTALTEPVKFLFYLALIVAWMVFVISFLVQAIVPFQWVDVRRALRPILFATLVFLGGGNFILWTENVRTIGGAMLQDAAQDAVSLFEAPGIPTRNTGDMPDASQSIYTDDTSCGTPARTVAAMSMNDYGARYLWSGAEDIHCASPFVLAGEFAGTYFERMDISNESDASKRQEAIALAAQGGLRQVTGIFMTSGAIIEQMTQLIFALALALVWFALLLSLIFAVFLPTEALFSSQIKAILAVVRASWLASFLIGIGLAVLKLVAASGNGFLMLIFGLVLIAVCLWQGKQALGTIETAVSSIGAVTASAPSAVGGMVTGWATTAALVAGTVASGGGLGMALGQVGSTMIRRAGRSVGDNPVAQAAGRVLSNRLADRLDARVEDRRIGRDAELSMAEAAWYERDYADAARTEAGADAAVQREAARQRARQQLARIKERQAERARQASNFPKAASLRRAAQELRGGAGRPAEEAPEDDAAGDPALLVTDLDPAELDRAVERLYEAGDDEAMQRQALAELAAQAQRRAILTGRRSRAGREQRSDQARAAIA